MKDVISYEDFAQLDLRIGRVKEAERVEGSDKLLRLVVDLGAEDRQIIAGIGKAYVPEELVNKQIAVVINLAPRSLMGLSSNGMVLAASGPEGPVLLRPEIEVENGTTIN